MIAPVPRQNLGRPERCGGFIFTLVADADRLKRRFVAFAVAVGSDRDRTGGCVQQTVADAAGQDSPERATVGRADNDHVDRVGRSDRFERRGSRADRSPLAELDSAEMLACIAEYPLAVGLASFCPGTEIFEVRLYLIDGCNGESAFVGIA